MTSQASAGTAPARHLPAVRNRAGLFATNASPAGPILRVALAVVLFPHGAQKLLGWFGGYGYAGTHAWFVNEVGLPGILATGLILFEFFGPLLLLVGAATRPVALALVGIMIGAIVTVHGQFGFLMNWDGQKGGEGYEFHLLMIGLALALVVQGAGAWSLDRRIARRLG